MIIKDSHQISFPCKAVNCFFSGHDNLPLMLIPWEERRTGSKKGESDRVVVNDLANSMKFMADPDINVYYIVD
jgi:hypothetical protein